MSKNPSWVGSLWSFLCSLKLAIVLASCATLMAVGGSLLMPANPQVFNPLDEMILRDWLVEVVPQAPSLTWWVAVAAVLVLLLGLNTLCCVIDWLVHLRSRWRKTGEYLIHFGFFLIVSAFLWGNLAGYRAGGQPIFVGQRVELPPYGFVLKLEEVKPLSGPGGRVMEMANTLALYRGDELLKRVVTRANHPLTWGGLVVIPANAGQVMMGGQLRTYSLMTVNYDPGANLALAGSIAMGCGVLVAMLSFYRKRSSGDHPDIE
jgi:cytochrome c biogenesis protein